MHSSCLFAQVRKTASAGRPPTLSKAIAHKGHPGCVRAGQKIPRRYNAVTVNAKYRVLRFRPFSKVKYQWVVSSLLSTLICESGPTVYVFTLLSLCQRIGNRSDLKSRIDMDVCGEK